MALLKSTGNKKVNLDFNKEFINTFSEKIENGNIEFINQTLKDLHEADVANLIENLINDYNEQKCVIGYRGFTPLFKT